MDKNLRTQLHEALDWMIDYGNIPRNDNYELTIQAYKARYGQPGDHITKGCTAEVDNQGMQSSCEFEEDVTKLHDQKTLDVVLGCMETVIECSDGCELQEPAYPKAKFTIEELNHVYEDILQGVTKLTK